MKLRVFLNKILFLLPRFIMGLYIFLISLFALDVFQEDYNFSETVFCLLLHLMPALIIAFFTWKAIKGKIWGSEGLIVMGIIFTWFFRSYQHLANFCLISLPLFIAGILFCFQKKFKEEKGL